MRHFHKEVIGICLVRYPFLCSAAMLDHEDQGHTLRMVESEENEPGLQGTS